MSTCDPAFVYNNLSTWTDQKSRDATSRTRGVHQPDSQGDVVCGATSNVRIQSAFMTSILINGLLEYTSFRGVSWPDYWEARDLMDGMTRFRDTELYQTVGNNRRDEDGYRYGMCLDLANDAEPNFSNAFVSQTLGMGWYARSLIDGTSGSFESKMKIQVQRTMGSDGVGAADHSSAQWNAVIYRLANPGPVLQTLSVASFAHNGGGSVHDIVDGSCRHPVLSHQMEHEEDRRLDRLRPGGEQVDWRSCHHDELVCRK